jgi:predicted HicB family RNase H-like nuclease
MQITKQNKPIKKNCSVIIDEILHQSISNLAHQEKVSRKELIRKAIDLYKKATIFEV